MNIYGFEPGLGASYGAKRLFDYVTVKTDSIFFLDKSEDVNLDEHNMARSKN